MKRRRPALVAPSKISRAPAWTLLWHAAQRRGARNCVDKAGSILPAANLRGLARACLRKRDCKAMILGMPVTNCVQPAASLVLHSTSPSQLLSFVFAKLARERERENAGSPLAMHTVEASPATVYAFAHRICTSQKFASHHNSLKLFLPTIIIIMYCSTAEPAPLYPVQSHRTVSFSAKTCSTQSPGTKSTDRCMISRASSSARDTEAREQEPRGKR